MGDEPSNSNVPFLLNDDIWEYVNDLVCQNAGILEQPSNGTSIELYPNPAKEQLNIAVKGETIGEVQVHNALGQPVATWNIDASSGVLDVGKFQQGIYFLTLPGSGKVQRWVKE
jgi:hypothetical protein